MAVNTYEIPQYSKEYLPVKVDVVRNGSPYDPTGDDVFIQLPLIDVEPADDWIEGSWQHYLVDGDEVYFARIVVGPGGDITLDPGDYDIWIKIVDSPEIPVKRAGLLRITT